MEFPLIIAIVVLSILFAKEKKKNNGESPMNRSNFADSFDTKAARHTARVQYTPEMIGREADNLRRASESALRSRAEALLPRYEQSALVADLVNTIRGCIQYGIIWDIALGDSDVSITTMTDALENRICLMTERYDYTNMGYQDPPRESEHRLALALALQKKLGMEYGVEYQFQYNPATENFILSDLMVSYRKKEENGVQLKSPI